MILVTGPTGSGKTTSLYAALNRIRNTANNILTIEDPIEYMIEGINQVQVNQKAGITFASALRSFLRQDPDVILVGEIRDQETAEIAVQAALTGHLVLSTLHTNDSLGAITRLADIGVDIYKVASSLEAVVAQRLVRTLCPSCKEETQPDDIEKKLIPFISQMKIEPKFYHAAGCQKCGFTGYKGRIGVYEILLLDEELKDLVGSGASIYQIRKNARKKGFQNLYEDALKHIAEGLTDYKEVLRVISPGNMDDEKSQQELVGKNISTPVPSNGEAKTAHPEKPDDLDQTIRDSASVVKFPADETPPPPSDEKRTPSILLVEDSSGLRKMVKVLIEKKTDWTLLEAEDGLKAVEIVSKHKPDIVVLDIMMPNMDGYEFLQHLRKNLSTAAIPVMVLTALNGPDNEVKSFDLGADDYVSKPYNPHVLLARIKRLLMRSNSHFFPTTVQTADTSKANLKLV